MPAQPGWDSLNTMQAVSGILEGFPGAWSVGAMMSPAHSSLARVWVAWLEATRACALPPSAALAPRPLKFALPDMHIYTIAAEAPRYRVKLIGSRFEEFTGRGLIGLSVEDVPLPTLRLAMSRILKAVETARLPIHIKAPRALALPSGDHKALESLWLPCADDGKRIDRVIAVSLLSPAATGEAA